MGEAFKKEDTGAGLGSEGQLATQTSEQHGQFLPETEDEPSFASYTCDPLGSRAQSSVASHLEL